MIDENRFRTMLQQLLTKSRQNIVQWREGSSQEGGELYMIAFPENGAINLYYNSPSEAPDFCRASLTVFGRLVAEIHAEEGPGDWELLNSLLAEARRCVFNFDKAVDAIEKALASGVVGIPEPKPTVETDNFLAFAAGRWKLSWSGPSSGGEFVEIDRRGGYHVASKRLKIEVLDYMPGARVVFLKHFLGSGRTPERNELAISPDGRLMTGVGQPDGHKLVYQRV